MRAVSVVLCGLAIVCTESRASADDRSPWLIVPVQVGSSTLANDGPARVVDAARSIGQPVVFSDAGARFDEKGPPQARRATPQDAAALDKCSEDALLEVASGHRDRARRLVDECLPKFEHALHALNRETKLATKLFDLCVYGVRASVESNNQEDAIARVAMCRRLAPDVKPSIRQHPPEVIGIIAQVDANLSLNRDSALRIINERAGCDVFLNGHHAGVTPFDRSGLAPGDYQVQVECEKNAPGRIHKVTIGSEPTTIHIDSRFDSAVRTQAGRLWLAYDSLHKAGTYCVWDAAEVGRLIEELQVLLVTREGPRLRLDRVSSLQRKVRASAWVDAGAGLPSKDSLVVALTSLTHGESVVVRGQRVTPAAPWKPLRTSTHAAREVTTAAALGEAPTAGASNTAGWVLGVSGVVGLGLGWTLYGVSAAGTPPKHDLVVPVVVSGAAGASALTASLPLWLPREDGVPWWAWGFGVAGAAVATYGVVTVMNHGDCRGRVDALGRCEFHADASRVAPMLLSTAAPLLAVPIVYVIRELTGHSKKIPTVGFQGGSNELRVHVTGSF